MTEKKSVAGQGVPTEVYEAQEWADIGLFEKQTKVFPKRVKGTFRTIKWIWLWVLLGVYYSVPWFRWDRGPNSPDQAILLDIPARRFYFLGIEIWPQEVFLLAGLLIIAAIGLFFITSLIGRVWCGWACPQTVWTDLFVYVERKIEGDRNARIKLDKAPWTFNKLKKRTLKHAIWVVIAMLTGGAWVFYFNDAPTLVSQLFTLSAPLPAVAWIAILTGTTYLLAGHAREQVCVYMCPYSRFQSVMLDYESLIVTYRTGRGEPRGRHKKGTTWEGRGHCIDCTQCIAVCPTGIDIRQGPQIACINCGLCADACDEVMDKVGLPKGLIALDSLANVERQTKGEPSRLRLLRPRIWIYILVLAMAGSAWIYALVTRDFLELNIIKDRNPIYVLLSNGDIRNTYTVHILNKYHEEKIFEFRAEGAGIDGFWLAGQQGPSEQTVTLTISPDNVSTIRVFVRSPKGALQAPQRAIHFTIVDTQTGESLTQETVFTGPDGGSR